MGIYSILGSFFSLPLLRILWTIAAPIYSGSVTPAYRVTSKYSEIYQLLFVFAIANIEIQGII
jgi:hypothetical protein